MRLDGFGIFVERMPAMVRFYRDVLGFEIREDENASNVYLEKDGTLFLLYRRADFEKMTGRRFGYAGPVNGHYEIALSVENHAAVDAAFREVVARRQPDRNRVVQGMIPERGCSISDFWRFICKTVT